MAYTHVQARPNSIRRDQLQAMLGVTSVSVVKHPSSIALNDIALA
jgi:hypothetical protein